MQVKSEKDAPTIGLLLCKSKNKVVAEYALRDTTKPIGVAEYQLLASLPTILQTALPSIEQLEQGLAPPPDSAQAEGEPTTTTQPAAQGDSDVI